MTRDSEFTHDIIGVYTRGTTGHTSNERQWAKVHENVPRVTQDDRLFAHQPMRAGDLNRCFYGAHHNKVRDLGTSL